MFTYFCESNLSCINNNGQMKVRAFITHKLKEHYSECQDRFAINIDRRSVAVSDGMSQSIFPDYWADVLSRFYANNGHCTDEDRINLCQEWKTKVDQYIDREKQEGRNPWRLQNSLASFNGAGATICGVTFDKANHWAGHVLGDSCIIEIDTSNSDQPKVVKVHTSEKKPFDSYPDYYESFPNKPGRGNIESFEGSLTGSNVLLLVSDPFSEFFAKNADSSVWLKRILDLSSHEEFCSLVDDWRNEGLHNDDSTLCIIEYDSKGALSITHEDKISELIEMSEQITAEDLQEEESQVISESLEENRQSEECSVTETVDDTNETSKSEPSPDVTQSMKLPSEEEFAVPDGDLKSKELQIVEKEEVSPEKKQDYDFKEVILLVEKKCNEHIENIRKSMSKQNRSGSKKQRTLINPSSTNQLINRFVNELKSYCLEMQEEITKIYQEIKKN